MKVLVNQYLLLMVLAHLLSNGCSGNRDGHAFPTAPVPASPVAREANNSKGSKNSAIRQIDFGNFEYPFGKNGRIALRDGKYAGNPQLDDYPLTLSNLVYGDVTRDGSEEAIVVLFENVRGSAMPYYVFIYSIVGRLPKLLWSFETGDRADGGLRQVYAENGDLVIELYGKGTSIGGKLYGSEKAACCPTFFSRSHYQWMHERFTRIGNIEVSANPATGAAVIMPTYRTTN